ncbi:2-amino-4-hydroxy-6-hydroxymethyldihydropteridine diphosphokinase [Sulfitobacter noctilucicola]|uniref:2-amino-4-hydroxy-6-hydroxymethyldihydropteridine pyrophosphokinase n=1 Tax=Sulfitobacter noctilucicola TaxID=1342301 RepID=A0A7W6Q4X3_9RHOB|nr:2-amino-4-hydroxy-6-hydroxymethyldihydropteridine diphosphokinase [Sulfitobacter noctilucicola]
MALGSNLTSGAGTPSQTLRDALRRLENKGAVIRAISPFYSTPAFPVGNGPDFVNAAAVVSAEWSAQQTLDTLHEIEAALGRKRDKRWGQRTLDIDLIAFGETVAPDLQTYDRWHKMRLDQQMDQSPEHLILPHPRMHERAFVLVPLADVAAEWVHPVLGRTVLQMRDALEKEDLAAVRLLE